MLALVSSPATMPRFSFDTNPAKALRGAALTDAIWTLHSILVNPASKLDEVKSAKRRMLNVIEETKRFPLPQMIVPPITLPPEREDEEIAPVELPDDTLVCTTCKRPVVPAFVQSRTAFTKKGRASSSRSFRAKRSDTRRGIATSENLAVARL
jgi:hypothetical protein